MEELQKKAIETYQNNLKYLELNDKELHDRVQGLSMLIEHREYKERYHLEYIKEDKNFDIYDTLEDKYLYDRKTSEFNKQAIKDINLDKMNSIDTCQHSVYNNKNNYFVDDSHSTKDKVLVRTVNDIFEYIRVFNQNTRYKNKQFKSIQKMTFLGTLLGSHIPLIGKKLNCLFYFISEANLEIFRLSLFVTDYAKLSNGKKIYFSIMEDEETFKNKFHLYLLNKLNENYMIKYYSSNYNISNYFDRIISQLYDFSPFKYTYANTINSTYETNIKNITKYPTWTNQSRQSILKNKQVLILAAGPSFGENIKWIKENQEYFFIISIGATVVKLIDNGILPDLITSLDAGEHTINHFPDKIKDKIENIPFLTSSMTHSSIIKQFNPSNCFLFEASLNLRNSTYGISGYSIGEVSFEIANILGANNIYLLGTDLALHQETGSTHDKDYEFKGKEVKIDDETMEDNAFFKDNAYSLRHNTLTVKGNTSDKVVTTTLFNLSLNAFNKKMRKFNKISSDLKVYNLNKHGAYIVDTIQSSIEKCPYKKIKDETDILTHLKSHSSINLTDEQKKLVTIGLNLVEQLSNDIKDIASKKTKNYTTFLEIREDIFKKVLVDFYAYNNLYLSEFFKNYILITEPYIFYCINDKTIKNESNLIKKVKKIWVKQMIQLCEDFKQNFEKLI